MIAVADDTSEPIYEPVDTETDRQRGTLMSTCSTASWGSDFSDDEDNVPGMFLSLDYKFSSIQEHFILVIFFRTIVFAK